MRDEPSLGDRIGAFLAVAALAAGLVGLTLSRPAAGPAGHFDGLYRGTVVPTAGSIAACMGGKRALRVIHDRFRGIFGIHEVSFAIATDGTIAGIAKPGHSLVPVRFSGTVANGVMTLEYGDTRCGMRAVLIRRPPPMRRHGLPFASGVALTEGER